MIRARFRSNEDDPRPVTWPKHPYWISGYGEDFAIIVAYADDKEEVFALWPEATEIDVEPADAYRFTDRFHKPDWLD